MLDEIKQIEGLLKRAEKLVAEGVRMPAYLQASYVYAQGEDAVGELVFNVPTDYEFYGRKLNLYLQSRTISLTSTESDLTFRPSEWLSTNDYPVGGVKRASCTFDIRDSMNGAAQNLPVTIASAFSARHGVAFFAGVGTEKLPVSAYPGALVFPVDYFLKPGQSLTVKVSPTFSRAGTENERQEFRVSGVLQGYKEVL